MWGKICDGYRRRLRHGILAPIAGLLAFALLQLALVRCIVRNLEVLDERQARALYAAEWLITGVSVAALLVGLVVTRLVTKRVSAPVECLSAAVQRMAKGEDGVRVACTSDDEIGALARSLNSLAEHTERNSRRVTVDSQLLEARVAERTRVLGFALSELEKLDAAKDRFLSSISHEMRTPLT